MTCVVEMKMLILREFHCRSPVISGSGRGSSALICLNINVVRHDIKFYGRMVMVVLKVPGEELERRSNRVQKVFDHMDHSGLVVGNIFL